MERLATDPAITGRSKLLTTPGWAASSKIQNREITIQTQTRRNCDFFAPSLLFKRADFHLQAVGGTRASWSWRSMALGTGEEKELDEYLAVAVDLAKQAGAVISSSFFDSNKAVENKGKVDLVTETDKSCEDLIFRGLKAAFPSHKFIGEETSAAAAAVGSVDELTDEPTWIVDPVDGTTNFVHRFPFVCVSIGLAVGKVPVVGVVYNPILDELFTGVKGRGAFLNGRRIFASPETEIGKALLATEIGVNRNEDALDATMRRVKALLFEVRSVRMCGSCALNLCGVALGRLDMFYELGFGGPWDVAAGIVIVEEAGGHAFDPSGGPVDMISHRIAACNGQLKESFVKALDGHV